MTLRRRSVVTLVAAAVGVLGSGVSAVLWLQHSYDASIERFGDPFRDIPPETRPPAAARGALNVLLLGSDSRISAGDPRDWARGAQRTDAIMVAHVPADRSGARVVSIPRDSWVPVPGFGRAKINAAYSWGGPELMVRTVEQLTRVRIDHVVVIDFTGFTKITDALGGVTLDVAGGPRQVDGATALAYVRQRHGLPGGDLDRVKRHQAWIRAVAGETMDRGTLANPLELNAVLRALTRSIATDDGLTFGELRGLALSLRGVREHDLAFVTAPVAGFARRDGQDVVRLDKRRGARLWRSIAAETSATRGA